MRPLAALLVACASLGLAACGQASTAGTFTGEEKSVEGVIEDLQQAGKRQKADDVCNTLLTAALQAKVAAAGKSCGAEMKKAIEDADAFDLEVQDVTISGTKATARVKGPDEGDGVVRTMTLQKVGGAWRIDSFGT
jgi:hypothetical protein